MAAEPRADDAAKRSARAVISIGVVRANAARKAADAGQRLYCADRLLALCEQRGDQAEAVRGPAGASLISTSFGGDGVSQSAPSQAFMIPRFFDRISLENSEFSRRRSVEGGS